MLSYHGLYRIDKKESSMLSDFAGYYQHVNRHTYALWVKQQSLLFADNRKLSHKQLIHDFYDKNNKNTYHKIPKFNFTLTPEHKNRF